MDEAGEEEAVGPQHWRPVSRKGLDIFRQRGEKAKELPGGPGQPRRAGVAEGHDDIRCGAEAGPE